MKFSEFMFGAILFFGQQLNRRPAWQHPLTVQRAANFRLLANQ